MIDPHVSRIFKEEEDKRGNKKEIINGRMACGVYEWQVRPVDNSRQWH
jgi:hypothetical protein